MIGKSKCECSKGLAWYSYLSHKKLLHTLQQVKIIIQGTTIDKLKENCNCKSQVAVLSCITAQFTYLSHLYTYICLFLNFGQFTFYIHHHRKEWYIFPQVSYLFYDYVLLQSELISFSYISLLSIKHSYCLVL